MLGAERKELREDAEKMRGAEMILDAVGWTRGTGVVSWEPVKGKREPKRDQPGEDRYEMDTLRQSGRSQGVEIVTRKKVGLKDAAR